MPFVARLPFSLDEFFALFAAYNRAVWPAVLLAYVLGAVTVYLVLKPGPRSGRIVAAILAAMWGWSGIAYHWLYFSTINSAALLFAAAFVIQGGIFFQIAWRDQLSLAFSRTARAFVGLSLIVYSTLVYPVLGLLLGNSLTELPMFGVTPCPVAMFSFGSLLLTTTPISRRVMVIPVLWAFIGGAAALLLGVWQDWMLPVAAVATLALLKRSGLLRAPTGTAGAGTATAMRVGTNDAR
jgi:Family of unknown function (DUF6064)